MRANTRRSRVRFLVAALHNRVYIMWDIAFFDTETTTGEVISRMSGDTILIQNAMGEKVGKFIQLSSSFIGGFIVALARGWLLSLVLLSCIPALVAGVGAIGIILTKMSRREQLAYAEAGNVVEQTVGAIRTVASFTGEKLAINSYNKKLQVAYVATAQQGLASGIGFGTMLLIIFCSFGLAIWFGSKLIIEKGYNGGQVITVIMAIMSGGMSLGQTSPCLNAFAAGQVAAYKMFETIKRKPQIDAYDTSGIENATNEEIRKAIELANAAKFIDKLPKGLDTMVGEHGTQLSGGQKQRIAIARAIVKNLKILLLDEATSALDVESERVVLDALANITHDRTTVIVAHRLTTVKNADLIAVVHAGKIVERGTHAELIKDLDGAYHQLVRLQEGGNKPEDARSMESDNQDTSWDTNITVGRSTPSRSRYSFNVIFELPDPIRTQTDIESEENTKKSEIDQEKRREVSIWRLAYLNKPELQVLLLGSIAAGLSGVVFPMFGVLLSTAIKIFYEPRSELDKNSRFWALVYVGLGISTLIVVPLQNYLFGVAGGKLIQRIRYLSFQKVVHQEISWFDDPQNSSGAIGARLSTDASIVRNLVGDALAQIVQNFSTVMAGLFISFAANSLLALVILSVLPFVGLQGFFQKRFVEGFGEDAKVMYEDATQVANDAVGNIRTIASFCAEKKVMNMYQNKCEAPMKRGVRIALSSGTGFGFSLFAFYCTMAFCFYIGAILVQHDKATYEDVFRVFFALTISALGVSQSTAFSSETTQAKASVASIFEILDSKPWIDSSNNEGKIVTTVKGNIELQHVKFKYPRRPDVHVFRDLCLTIPSGKVITNNPFDSSHGLNSLVTHCPFR
ncbi:P-glycoprotein 9 [Actinidia rufa]|uniref:p-glycoprotein 9 n=1 Tax=Actinidia rufa TaxID=165716 RepID=A0A7J0EQ69_9ERIC|nr:P-glycoprotein 9 [Actinidia rufa]